MRFDRFGDYSELKAVMLPDPEASADELLVRIMVAAVNPIDSTVRLGRFGGAKPPPLVQGTEACGVIVDSAVAEFPSGMRVLVRGGFGIVRDGTWQELVTARPDQVLSAPDGLDDTGVAASGSGFMAAALALERAGFAPGKSVLALGVGGAVGNATYQLARSRLAGLVVGTASSTAKAELARSHGLGNVIDLATESLEDGVKRATGGRGIDIVVDSIGGPVTGSALTTLADDGVLVALGYVAGAMASINLQNMVSKRARIVAISLARLPAPAARALYESMRQEFDSGVLRPLIARSFLLEDAAEAQRFLDQDRPFGKVVLKV